MAHILLRSGMGLAVVCGGVKADHGEGARGDDKAEQIGEFAGHWWGAVPVKCAPPTGHGLGRCCSCSHGPIAYRQTHRNTQRRLALARCANTGPAHNRLTHVQLNREPLMAARLAFPLARHTIRLMPVGRRRPDFATAAFGAIHGRYGWSYPTDSTQ